MRGNLPAKKIGIVSGFGPLAGQDILARILKYSAQKYGAIQDHEYPEIVLISNGVEGFNQKAAIDDNFLPAILKIVDQLNLLDVDVIGVACNTAHIFYDQVALCSKAPVVNLIEEVVKIVPKNDTYLLLSSFSTKNSKMYSKALDNKGVKYIVPDENSQTLIDGAIHLVMANKLEAAGKKIEEVLKSDTGKYAAIIAACTELPIALAHAKINLQTQIIDSNYVLAKALADIAYQQDN